MIVSVPFQVGALPEYVPVVLSPDGYSSLKAMANYLARVTYSASSKICGPMCLLSDSIVTSST